MNDKDRYRELTQNSTSVEHLVGQSYYEQAMEQATNPRSVVDSIDIDTRRIEGDQARAAAEKEYPTVLDYVRVCSENIAALREEALTRDDFDLVA